MQNNLEIKDTKMQNVSKWGVVLKFIDSSHKWVSEFDSV